MKTKISFPLIASAVGLACASGAANAALITVTQTFSSVQGNVIQAAANPDASINMPAMVFTLQSDGYQVGNTVTLTIGGASIRSAAGIGSVTCTTSAGVVLKYVSATSSAVTLNVEARADATVDTRGATCTIPANAISVLTSSLTAAANVTVNYVASTGTSQYDALIGGTNAVSAGGVASSPTSYTGSPAGAYRIHTARNQFVATTSGASPAAATGVINVYSAATGTTDMKTFATKPVVAIGVRNFGGTQSPPDINSIAGSDVTSIITTLTGDFSFLDNDGNGCTAADLTNGWGRATGSNLAGSTTPTINAACTQITLQGSLGATASLEFSVGNAGGSTQAQVGSKTLATQTISRSTVVNVLSNGTTTPVFTSTSAAANTWTTNGWTAAIPYMPYGTGISRIIYATNNTGGAASIGMYAYNEAGTLCDVPNFPSTSIAASGVANLSAAADTGIAACFGASYNGKVRLLLTSNLLAQSADTVSLDIPSLTGTEVTSSSALFTGNTTAADLSAAFTTATATATGTVTRASATIDLYSAYNVSGNRVTVQNTTNNR